MVYCVCLVFGAAAKLEARLFPPMFSLKNGLKNHVQSLSNWYTIQILRDLWNQHGSIRTQTLPRIPIKHGQVSLSCLWWWDHSFRKTVAAVGAEMSSCCFPSKSRYSIIFLPLSIKLESFRWKHGSFSPLPASSWSKLLPYLDAEFSPLQLWRGIHSCLS